MNINITLIVVAGVILMMMIRGYKKGMTKEISGLISLAVTLFVVSLIIMLYTSFHAEEGKNITVSFILLVLTAIIYTIVKIFLKSAKLLSKLPVIKIVDRFLGIFVGALEGLVLVWMIYVLNEAGIFGGFSEQIVQDTMSSEILRKIYEYNYLIKISSGL